MKKSFFALLAVCAFSGTVSASSGKTITDAFVNLKPVNTKEVKIKTNVEDDKFWFCYEVNRVVVRNLDLGITETTVTYHCTWYTLDGPGTPPFGNHPGPGNGIPTRP